MELVLVSACLVGDAVRFDGGDMRCDHEILQRWLREGRVVPVCPEVAGGLPVPRPRAKIADGAGGMRVLAGAARVIDSNGRDVTDFFVRGAEHALEQAREQRIRIAVLKEGSPSCGTGSGLGDRHSDTQTSGLGVTAARLQQAGIHVFSEAQLAEAEALLMKIEAESAD